jgi:hypothetical protein
MAGARERQHRTSCLRMQAHALADRYSDACADIESYALADACADVSTLTHAVDICVCWSVIYFLEPQPRTHTRNITIAISNPVVVH